MEQTVVQTIVQLISNLGFPIAMCIYFIYDKTKSGKETIEILNRMNETLAVIKDYIEKEGNN